MSQTSADPETIRFPISGMTCGSCVDRIARVVRKLDGVTGVKVDLRKETATVRREPALVSNATLAAAVAEAGYEADIASLTVIPAAEARSFLERLLGRTT